MKERNYVIFGWISEKGYDGGADDVIGIATSYGEAFQILKEVAENAILGYDRHPNDLLYTYHILDVQKYYVSVCGSITFQSLSLPIKIYLDDRRNAPDNWIRCYWPYEVIELLKSEEILEISLDHDLGDDKRGTGYDVLNWIEEQVYTQNYIPPTIHIHTANPSARQKMEAAVQSIYK